MGKDSYFTGQQYLTIEGINLRDALYLFCYEGAAKPFYHGFFAVE